MSVPTNQRRLIMPLLLVAGLLAGNAWAYARLTDARDGASAQANNLARCRALTSKIESLRKRPALAGAQDLAAAELARRLESAAAVAQIPAGGLSRIAPEPPRRLANSAYLEKPTQVMLRQVRLEQVLRFTQSVIEQSPGLHVTALRLSSPRDPGSGDNWSCDLTLGYWIYAPLRGDGATAEAKGAI